VGLLKKLILVFVLFLCGCNSNKNNSPQSSVCPSIPNPKSLNVDAQKQPSSLRAMKSHPGAQVKLICSGLWIANRSLEDIQKQDLFGENLSHLKVDTQNKQVRINIGEADAVSFYRGNSTGCSLQFVPKNEPITTPLEAFNADGFAKNKLTTCTSPDCKKIHNKVSCAFNNFGQSNRALLVFHNGNLISENYATGFQVDTPQLGWSMTKSVLSTLVGLRLADLGESVDLRTNIHPALPRLTFAQLLQMESGLDYTEEYSAESPLTRVLFESSNPVDYIKNKIKPNSDELKFHYSTVDSILLSKSYMNLFPGGRKEAYAFARERLFKPLGMTSALIESDGAGNLAGGAFMYATPRDWARFGLLFLNDGMLGENQILPTNWVKYISTGTEASKGHYGAHWWIDQKNQVFAAIGIMGQSIYIYPKSNLVIVRQAWRTESTDPLGEALKEIFKDLVK
jgi:CubicO group peptidase (beta-lactamase class C family)